MPPGGPIEKHVIVRAWVPLDDHHTMFWNLSRKRGRGPVGATKGGPPPAAGLDFMAMTYEENTSDWLGRWRLTANAENDYEIDRDVQREASFTGIKGIHLQDQMITESMGAVSDRARERLGTSDQMIIQTRRRLLDAAKALRDDGRVPPGAEEPNVYTRVRGGEMVLPNGADWVAEYETRRHAEG